jgi:hypothetical protein
MLMAAGLVIAGAVVNAVGVPRKPPEETAVALPTAASSE